MLRRFLQYCVPSLVAACLGGLLASFWETVPECDSLLSMLGGTGFFLVFAVPLGFALSLVGRGLLAAWDVPSMVAHMRDTLPQGELRLSAWLIFTAMASVLFAGLSYGSLLVLFSATRSNALVAIVSPGILVALCLLLVAISRPTVDLLTTFLGTRQRHELFRPRNTLFVLLAGAVTSGLGIWFFAILPRFVHLDTSFVLNLGLLLLCLIAVPPLWRLLPLGVVQQRLVLGSLLLVVAVCWSSAYWLRYQRLYPMLSVWGNTQMSGWSIDMLYDVQGLREDFEIQGIAPSEIAGFGEDRAEGHPNVVLITIDTIRADQVPLYGGAAKMPNLVKFGDKGVVFDRAYSPGNVTRRSLPAIVTGLSPRRIRGRVVGWALRMDPRHIMLAERFSAGGYDTAGFFCCTTHFAKRYKLGIGRGLQHLEIAYKGKDLSDTAVAWLKDRSAVATTKPLFLWTHFIDPHNWAKDHKSTPSARSKKQRYQLSLGDTDTALQVLLEGIWEELGDNTVVVVTSDHGEGLGDHGVSTHGSGLYNSEIHVPLIISGPGIAAGRMAQVVGLVDLAPTLLELAGFVPPAMPQMDGLSVAPELLKTRKDELGLGEAYSVMVPDRSVPNGQAAVISGHYKLIEKQGTFQLFDLQADPKEKKDVQTKHPRIFAAMKARLERRKAIDRVPAFP